MSLFSVINLTIIGVILGACIYTPDTQVQMAVRAVIIMNLLVASAVLNGVASYIDEKVVKKK